MEGAGELKDGPIGGGAPYWGAAAAQAASITGVAPHPRQSGKNRTSGRCQAGRAPVRRVLYMATLAAIRSKSSALRTFFERLRTNGKPFKLAIVAAMRKFIILINTMIKQSQDWKPQKA